MYKYLPLTSPDPQEWLSLDESERIDLVRVFHAKTGGLEPMEALNMHSAIHVLVENQIAMEVEPVPATVSRLIRQGLDRHEAIHAIGAVISAEVYELQQKNRVPSNQGVYRRRLEKLTAKRWRKGKW